MHMYCEDFFFFNDTATTEIYTLSLHDALPILEWLTDRCLFRFGRHQAPVLLLNKGMAEQEVAFVLFGSFPNRRDRKSTRLNSSHANISYAVFCLKKKKNKSSNTLVQY